MVVEEESTPVGQRIRHWSHTCLEEKKEEAQLGEEMAEWILFLDTPRCNSAIKYRRF